MNKKTNSLTWQIHSTCPTLTISEYFQCYDNCFLFMLFILGNIKCFSSVANMVYTKCDQLAISFLLSYGIAVTRNEVIALKMGKAQHDNDACW